MNKNINELIDKADKEYKPFPKFKDWLSVNFSGQSLDNNNEELIKLKEDISKDDMEKALQEVTRMAAITTGALEGLYEADRGITVCIAQEGAILSADVAQKKEDMESYYKSQLKTYEQLNFDTETVPITEAYIRNLHKEICEPQKKYQSYIYLQNEKKVIQKDLHHGKYKDLPNHVILKDGNIHSYAPVIETKSEMQRLVNEMNSDEFLKAHSIYQASYVHYSIASIHPFSDGNGRVARALASIFTYKSFSVPFLIFVEDKERYFSALNEADNDNYESFVQFTYNLVSQAIKLVFEIFRVSTKKSLDDYMSDLDNVYVTKGGYTHSQIDSAGHELLKLIASTIIEQLKVYKGSKHVVFNTGLNNAGYNVQTKNMRCPVTEGGLVLDISAITPPPANTSFDLKLWVEVPMNADEHDYIIIRENQYNHILEVEISEIIPQITTVLTHRIDLYAKSILQFLMASINQLARQKLTESGY